MQRMVMIVLLTVIVSCGSPSDSTYGAPYISAEVDTVVDSDAGAAIVYVINSFTQEPIVGASVSINGVKLAYSSSDQAYRGELSVPPGKPVVLKVLVNSQVYTATAKQFISYPGITQPASGDTWTLHNCYNKVTWSSAEKQTDDFYAIGVADMATGELMWPAPGELQLVPITETSFNIYGGFLTAGEAAVMLGIAKRTSVASAAPDSELIVARFGYAQVTVADVYPPPLSIDLTPNYAAIELGQTQQFTAKATYCDLNSEDVTGSVLWSSSDAAVATISNAAGSQGTAVSVHGGSTTITAALGNVSSSQTLTVNPYFSFPLISQYVFPEALAIGDVTGDGKNDVVVITGDSSDSAIDYKLILFKQDSDGRLSLPIAFSTSGSYVYSPYSVAIGDINNDGKEEVVIGNSGKNIEVFMQDGNGGLISKATYTTVNSTLIKIADLNHDGRLDVVGIGSAADTADILLQNQYGTLNPPVTYHVDHAGWDALQVGDVNSDGLTDIIVMSGQGMNPQIGILKQKADGTFNTAVYYPGGGSSIGVGDVSGDGLNDVVDTSDGLCVLYQNNQSTLDAPVCYHSYGYVGGVQVADMNNDGRKDIVLFEYPQKALAIYLQSPDGTMQKKELYPYQYSAANHGAIAIGDINSDGIKDLVALDFSKGLIVLYRE